MSGKGATVVHSNDEPLVTILIPTYNRADYLDECLYSVLVQDYLDCEVFVRDNNSTDNTAVTVERYEAAFRHFAGFRYKRNDTNVGFRDNFVHGVSECKGRFVLILMDDDFLISRTAISSFVRAMLSTEDTSLCAAPAATYTQGQTDENPRQLIDIGAQRDTHARFTTVSGEYYFLNSWTKYGPICMSSTMFDKRLLLESPWAEWSQRAGLDVNIYHLLSLKHKVSVITEPLACYRVHGSNDFKTFPLEDAMESHGHVQRWYDFAKANSQVSLLSLFVWRLKTVTLKEQGTIRWLHDREPPALKPYLCWLKGYNLLHYLVMRYLSPRMIAYDKEAAANAPNALRRTILGINIRLRTTLSRFILRLDRVMHDPECRVGVKGRVLRLVLKGVGQLT